MVGDRVTRVNGAAYNGALTSICVQSILQYVADCRLGPHERAGIDRAVGNLCNVSEMSMRHELYQRRTSEGSSCSPAVPTP